MQTCQNDWMICEKLLDAFPQRQAHAVTKFDPTNSKRKYFLQHLVAPSVASRIPTGRECGSHRFRFRVPSFRFRVPRKMANAPDKSRNPELGTRNHNSASPGDQSQFVVLSQVRVGWDNADIESVAATLSGGKNAAETVGAFAVGFLDVRKINSM